MVQQSFSLGAVQRFVLLVSNWTILATLGYLLPLDFPLSSADSESGNLSGEKLLTGRDARGATELFSGGRSAFRVTRE